MQHAALEVEGQAAANSIDAAAEMQRLQLEKRQFQNQLLEAQTQLAAERANIAQFENDLQVQLANERAQTVRDAETKLAAEMEKFRRETSETAAQ